MMFKKEVQREVSWWSESKFLLEAIYGDQRGVEYALLLFFFFHFWPLDVDTLINIGHSHLFNCILLKLILLQYCSTIPCWKFLALLLAHRTSVTTEKDYWFNIIKLKGLEDLQLPSYLLHRSFDVLLFSPCQKVL